MKKSNLFIGRLGEIIKGFLRILAIYSLILFIVIGDIANTFFMLQETLSIPFSAFAVPKIAAINIIFIVTFGLASKVSSVRKRFLADLFLSTCWIIYSVGLLSMMT